MSGFDCQNYRHFEPSPGPKVEDRCPYCGEWGFIPKPPEPELPRKPQPKARMTAYGYTFYDPEGKP